MVLETIPTAQPPGCAQAEKAFLLHILNRIKAADSLCQKEAVKWVRTSNALIPFA